MTAPIFAGMNYDPFALCFNEVLDEMARQRDAVDHVKAVTEQAAASIERLKAEQNSEETVSVGSEQ